VDGAKEAGTPRLSGEGTVSLLCQSTDDFLVEVQAECVLHDRLATLDQQKRVCDLGGKLLWFDGAKPDEGMTGSRQRLGDAVADLPAGHEEDLRAKPMLRTEGGKLGEGIGKQGESRE
jgi:hypothetical protein